MSKQISQLTALTTAAAADEFAVYDTSGTETKKITLPNLEASMTLDNIGGTLSASKGGTGVTSLASLEPLLTLDNLAGILAVTKGGTGLATVATGSVLAYNSADTASAVTSASGLKFLRNNAGTVSWETQNSMLTFYPSHIDTTATITTQNLATNTEAHIHLFNIPTRMVVNKATFNITSHSTAGTVQVALYSEDGQTQLASETSSTSAGTGPLSTTLSSLVLEPGNYWLLTVPISTTNFFVATQNPSSNTDDLRNISGEPVVAGTLTVTAGTPPATITPTAVSVATHDEAIVYRFDN